MKTYEYAGDAMAEARAHPWRDALGDAAGHYYDFTASPELIRTSLEDFKPFERYPAVEVLYALLERVNHPRSPLESNDCSFVPPGENRSSQVQAAVECSGRVMLLFRDLAQNTRQSRVAWLKAAFHYHLAQLDQKFTLGMVGTTLLPVRYLSLPEAEQLGQQLMLSFWAFGETEPLAMQNLARLLRNLTQALRGVCARVVQGD
jgi:hypothetical protein